MAISENIVFSLLKNAKPSSMNHFVASCPFCYKDSHFFINRKTLLFDCKKCHQSGNIYKLLKHLDKLYLIEGERVEKLKTPQLGLDVIINNDEFYEEAQDCKLPIGFKEVKWNDDNKYSDYLRDRKFTEFDFDLYKPGYTDLKKKLDNYVIIQVTKDFVTKGYVTRYILNEKDSNFNPDAPRYQNAKKAQFSKLLLGYDELTNNTNSIIMTEGAFDKISVTTELDLHDIEELKCVCSFGNKISGDQILLLRKVKSLKNIFLMHDTRDSVENMKKSGIVLSKYWNVYVCDIGIERDAGEANSTQIVKAINESREIYQFVYKNVQQKTKW